MLRQIFDQYPPSVSQVLRLDPSLLNRPDYFDEFVVFQGASYFRAVAKGQGYGLSARGLALNTAAPNGEEFPVFRTFWIERPRLEANVIVVHALLDSAPPVLIALPFAQALQR